MLKPQRIVFKQEWIKIFRTPFYGLFAAFSLCILSILFYKLLQDYLNTTNILSTPNQSSGLTREVIKPYLGWVVLILALVTPILSTQSLAFEKQSSRLMFWINSPLSAGDLIAGKYLALIAYLFSIILLYLAPIFLLSITTPLDWGLLLMGIMGAWLFSCLVLAFGFCISSLMTNSLLALGANYLTGLFIILVEWLNPLVAFNALAKEISPLNHIHYFLNGAFYFPDLSYLLCSILFCLFIAGFFLQDKFHNH